MLARISSGASGIREYLETGRKKGREFDRELIDERLVLYGDLLTTDAIIASIETKQAGAARYLHITLGFAERYTNAASCGPGEINLAKIREVEEAYRQLLMAAYHPDEYAWYAEAHVPKVTHDLHATTGEAIERLPHVHIVLPMRNLVDGQYLNPAGYSKHNIKYQQAIQEVVNIRHGLRSPVDSPRDAAISPLAKHSATFETGTPKQLRADIARLVADKRIQTFEQLIATASTYGEVRVRQGKEGDYVNVKPSWAAKGINLKEYPRQSFGTQTSRPAQQDTRARDDFDAVLTEWTQRVAFEARYVDYGNRKHYRNLDTQGQQTWLAAQVKRSMELRRLETPGSIEFPLQFMEAPEPSSADKKLLAIVAALQKESLEAQRREPPRSFADVPSIEDIPQLQHSEYLGLHLHQQVVPRGNARNTVDEALERAQDAQDSKPSAPRLTYLSTLLDSRKEKTLSPEQLKSDTSPILVIEAAAKQFRLVRNEYDVTSASDGTPRIRHQDKLYNLGDFFIKHLNTSWDDAKVILERCYLDTLADAMPPPDKQLWRAFSNWRTQRHSDAGKARETARADLTSALREERASFKAIKSDAQRMAPAERQRVLATARAEQLVKIQAAREHNRQARERAAVPHRNAMYRSFLSELANGGNLAALGELRRLAKPEPGMDNTVTGRVSKAVFPQPSYRVDHSGKVTYFVEGRAVVTDSVRGVTVVKAQDTAYALALKIAVARYGSVLTLNGDKLFIDEMVKAARASGMRLEIQTYPTRPGAPPPPPPPPRPREDPTMSR